jgi:hypothetical protein
MQNNNSIALLSQIIIKLINFDILKRCRMFLKRSGVRDSKANRLAV